MKKVTREEFYGEIFSKNLDVHPQILGRWLSIFRFRNGQEFGRVVETEIPGTYPHKEEFFLSTMIK